MMDSGVAAWELLGRPQLEALSELLHENTKIRPSARGFHISADVLQVMTEGFKRYDLAETVPLPAAAAPTMPLALTLEARRSVREYTGTPLAADVLSGLLRYAYGQTGAGDRRYAPSAGALYPLELYPVVLEGAGAVPSGLYHYNVRDHALERLPADDLRESLAGAIFVPEAARTASVAIAITAVFGRTKIKYGERGYRFALLEAGHVAHNLCLIAAAFGLATAPIGGFVDDALNGLLDVDGVDEAAVYLVTIGTPHADAK